ncbi:hypothetical protein QTN25_008729 [Entamoeba marina]
MGDLAGSFSAIDKDGNGSIDLNEFVEFVKSKFDVKKESVLKLIFSAIDNDKNGQINEDEFKKFAVVVGKVGVGASDLGVKVLFNLIDANSDGVLTYKEVSSFFKENDSSNAFDINTFYAVADENGDGVISLEEFLKYHKDN